MWSPSLRARRTMCLWKKKKKTLCKQSQVGCTMRSSPALKQESINPPETCYSLSWHFKVRDGKVTCLKVPGSGLPLSIPASQPMTILWSHTRGPYNISHPTGKGHWEAVQTTWLLGVHLLDKKKKKNPQKQNESMKFPQTLKHLLGDLIAESKTGLGKALGKTPWGLPCGVRWGSSLGIGDWYGGWAGQGTKQPCHGLGL